MQMKNGPPMLDWRERTGWFPFFLLMLWKKKICI